MPPSTPDERAPDSDFTDELSSHLMALDEETSTSDKVQAGAQLIDGLILASKFDTAEAVHTAYEKLKEEVGDEGFEGRDRFLHALLDDYFKFCGRTKDVGAFIRDVQYVYSNKLENNEACLTYVSLFLAHAVTGISKNDFDSLVSQLRASFDFGIPAFYTYDYFLGGAERLKITFPNLAGKQGCDPVIRAELTSAGIDLVEGDKSKGEVPTTVTGKLGHFKFERAWHYWTVSGDVPLAIAEKMYADPVGRRDVRVRGDIGCPPPGEQAKYYDKKDRKEVIVDPGGSKRAEIENQVKGLSFGQEIRDQIAQTARFVESLDETPDARPVIISYDIDSPKGLKLFADSVRNIQ